MLIHRLEVLLSVWANCANSDYALQPCGIRRSIRTLFLRDMCLLCRCISYVHLLVSPLSQDNTTCSSFVFDNSRVTQSVIGKWDVVCDRAWIKATIQVRYFKFSRHNLLLQSTCYIGQMGGSMTFGVLADRWWWSLGFSTFFPPCIQIWMALRSVLLIFMIIIESVGRNASSSPFLYKLSVDSFWQHHPPGGYGLARAGESSHTGK